MTGTLRRALRPAGLYLLVLAPLVAGCDATPTDAAPEGAIVAIGIQPSAARNSGGVTVSPGAVELVAGATVRLVALDASGNPVNAKWSSSDASIASVAGDGAVLGVGPGAAVVTAKSRGSSAAATVRVSAPAAVEPPPVSPAPAEGCAAIPHARLVPVSTAKELEAALAGARPGDQIRMADGVYTGYFKATLSGAADARISLCGTRQAVLTTGSLESGHGLWVQGASYWTLHGFTVSQSLGGVAITEGSHNVLERVEVRDVGQHAIRIGIMSSQNVVRENRIHRTGRRAPEYGEGIYVGSYHTSWCARTSCGPDRSDGNRIEGNVIGPDVTAEHVQVMEGTTGGLIRANVFDGRGMGAPNHPYADSWVAVMGNGWIVEDNRGTSALRNGFEVWVELDGWGRDNVFRRNDADVQAEGYGFHLNAKAAGSVVSCGNAVRNAGSGMANVACTAD
jgi:hypothetical protein